MSAEAQPAPQGPPGRFANGRRLIADPVGYHVALRDIAPVVSVLLPAARALVLHDPAAVRRVLVDNAAAYAKQTRGYRTLRLLLGNGLVTSEGDFWRRQRRIAQPAFRRKALAGFAEQMGAAIEGELEGWTDGAQVDVASAMNRYALQVVLDALFASSQVRFDFAEMKQRIQHMLDPFWFMSVTAFPLPELLPTPRNARFWLAKRWVRRLVDRIIADARQTTPDDAPADLMTMLMGARDPETGAAMTDAQLRDEIVTLIGAGHETTASGLSFGLHLLATHPEVADRVAAEAEATIAGSTPTSAEIAALKYTRQVWRETLRLYPPIWVIARRAEQDDVLGGYRVEAGDYITMCPFSLHRHPEYWPDPGRFDPDRWGPDQPAPDRGIYLPFSRGRRQCIGDRFSDMEAIAALATVARRFHLSSPPGFELDLHASLTLRPAAALPLEIRRR